MSEKTANVQRRTLEVLPKTWSSIAQDHNLAAWKQNIKKRGVAQEFCSGL